MPDWLTIAEGLHSTSAERVRRNLVGAGVECRLEGDTVQVARDGNVDQAWKFVQELLECNAMILAAADPDKVRPYKALEPDVLLLAALDAVQDATDDRDLIALLLHGFVWSQGLQNANHRSATLLVNELLDAKDISEDQVEACSGPFWDASTSFAKRSSRPILARRSSQTIWRLLAPMWTASVRQLGDRLRSAHEPLRVALRVGGDGSGHNVMWVFGAY